MTSGRFAATAIIKALEKNDTSRRGLQKYAELMEESYIISDLRKYRRFNEFRLKNHELFTTLPQVASKAAREMLAVNGISKKKKQKTFWQSIRRTIPLRKLLSIVWKGWRSVT